MSSQSRSITRGIARRQLELEGVPHPCRAPIKDIEPFFRTEWKKAFGRAIAERDNGKTAIRKKRRTAK